MQTYLKLVSKSFQRSITYRLEYFVNLLNAFMYIFIFTSVWKTVSKEHPNSLGVWDEESLVQYAIISTIVKVSFGRNESLLTSKIKSGDIAYDLLKPYNLFLYYAADSLGVSLFQTFARSIPLFVLSFTLLGKLPSIELMNLFKFVLVYIFAFGIFLSFGFMLSALAFFFTEVFSFMILYSALVALFSGSVIPVNILPDFFQKFVSYTPFPYLFFYPTAVLLGTKIDFSYLELLFNYIIQFFSLFGLSYFLYTLGVRKVEYAGG